MGQVGDTDEVKYNVGLISEWHQMGEDYSVFLSLLKPGDLIEFKRDGYCHWSVYVGEHPLGEPSNRQEIIPLLPCIVHRANPTDNPEHTRGMFSASKSLRKGVYGIGDVVVEPLRDVWQRSEARINNSMDNSSTPYPSQKIVERAMSVVLGQDRQSYTPYNVVTNNCEHFACWCRSGWSVSSQVARRADQVLKLGMVAGAAILPRPIAIMGGLCLAGLQMMNEVRRSDDNPVSDMQDTHEPLSITFDDVHNHNLDTETSS